MLAGPRHRDPDFVRRVRERVEHHGLGDHITLPGPVDGAVAPAAADLLVAPSRVETFGMAAAEALARRVPVLAADVGGLRDVVRGIGVLVPAEDVPAFAAELRGWWAQPAVRSGRRLSATFPACRVRPWFETSRRLHRVLRTLA